LFHKKEFITDEELGIRAPSKKWCAPTSILGGQKGPEVSGRIRELKK
jgi:hypothetical protein